jgi:hypothetical protein
MKNPEQKIIFSTLFNNIILLVIPGELEVSNCDLGKL